MYAHSPQAKGRIERLFKTFQDRVIKEMRLAGISTLAEANQFFMAYLPAYNQRFRVQASQTGDLHRPLPAQINLDDILCIKTKRLVRKDSTIAHDGKLYQIEERIAIRKVTVAEKLDRTMEIRDQKRSLKYKEITQRAIRMGEPVKKDPSSVKRKKIKPAADHLWHYYNAKLFRKKRAHVARP